MAEYPLPVFHFEVEWGGTKGDFTEISGLSKEAEILEYRNGGSKQYSTVKLPGLQKEQNVTLKRGIFRGDNELYDWWKKISQNKTERRPVIINLLDSAHKPVLTWTLTNAWAVKVEHPNLHSSNNEIAVESIELAHEGLKIISYD